MNNKLKNYIHQTKNIQIALIFLMIFSNGIMVLNSFLNIKMTNAIIDADFSKFLFYLLFVFFILLLVSLLNYFIGVMKSKSNKEISLMLREDYLDEFIKTYNYNKESKTDKAISNLTNDVNYVIDNGLLPMYELINLILGIILPLLGSAMIHWSFIIVFPVSLLISIVGSSYFSPVLQNFSKQRSSLNEELISMLNDFFPGFNTLYSYNSIDIFKDKVKKSSLKLEETKETYNKKYYFTNSIMMCLMIISQFVYIINVGVLTIKGIITPGSIVGLMSIAQAFYSNSQMAISMKMTIESSKPIIDKLLNEEKIKNNDNIKVQSIDGHIKVENLFFSYTNDSNNIISNFNDIYPIGEKYLIRGKSGSGKSTFLKLISGRLSNYSGNILYDDINLSKVPFEELSHLIAYIEQNPYIFEDTLKYNITLGNKIDHNIYNDAIFKSGLLDFINSKKDKDEFLLTKNGNNLSGGQKQRIAIARALVYNKRIFMIDEGFQGLDYETANEIEKNLLEMKDITLFMISHKEDKDRNLKYDKIITF